MQTESNTWGTSKNDLKKMLTLGHDLKNKKYKKTGAEMTKMFSRHYF